MKSLPSFILFCYFYNFIFRSFLTFAPAIGFFPLLLYQLSDQLKCVNKIFHEQKLLTGMSLDFTSTFLWSWNRSSLSDILDKTQGGRIQFDSILYEDIRYKSGFQIMFLFCPNVFCCVFFIAGWFVSCTWNVVNVMQWRLTSAVIRLIYFDMLMTFVRTSKCRFIYRCLIGACECKRKRKNECHGCRSTVCNKTVIWSFV